MTPAPLIFKKNYLLSVVPPSFSKQEIVENGKYARQEAIKAHLTLVIDFRKATLNFSKEEVIDYFNTYYGKKEGLLKLHYVAHWFPKDSHYVKEIDQEWLNHGVSTCPFDNPRDIIRWIREIEKLHDRYNLDLRHGAGS